MVLISGGENDGVDVLGASKIAEDDVVGGERPNSRFGDDSTAQNGIAQRIVDHLLTF